MAEQTAIAWTNATFNIGWGCFKVSPGCKHCYADTFATNRAGQKGLWGPPATTQRRIFGDKHWQDPLKWNRQAEAEGARRRVFSSSMCDVFEDHPTIAGELPKLWRTIKATPWLDWQLLTKRAERIASSLPDDWSVEAYPNVWLGVSVENQEYADLRIPHLLAVEAAVRWLSVEPLLAPVTLAKYIDGNPDCPKTDPDCTGADGDCHDACEYPPLHWVIVGGESGPGYRPMDHAWARTLRDECVGNGVAYFMKQSAAPRTEMGTYLIEADGSKWAWKQYPRTPFQPEGDFAAPVRIA
jgi:protein gp37